MVKFSVSSNIGEIAKRMGMRAQQHPLAVAKALTFTAEAVRDAERAEIDRVFDRPTPYTKSSLYLKSATPARLEARVYFKDMGSGRHYLQPQVYGGDRPLKVFERYLQQAGWLPAGMFAVPGERAKRDRFGNWDRGELIKVLSALRALPQQGYLANRSARSEARRAKSKKPRALVNYFVGRPNPAAPDGVWERVPGGNGLRPIVVFVKRPQYRQRFDFYGVAARVTRAVFPVKLAREFQRVGAPLQRAA